MLNSIPKIAQAAMMLILIVLIFSTTTQSVDAQTSSSGAIEFCLSATGTPLKKGDKSCDTTFTTTYSTSTYNVNGEFYGVCRSTTKSSKGYVLMSPDVVNKNASCPTSGTQRFNLLRPTVFETLKSSATNNTSPKPVNSSTGNTTNNSISQSGDCQGLVKSGPLCLPQNPFTNSSSLASSGSMGDLAKKVINFLLWLAGIVAVVMIIFGGYQTMTAGGNPDQAKNGRKTLTNAVLGLVIVMFSFAIVQIVTNFISAGNK